MSAVPQLRGLLASSTKNHLYGMILFVTTSTLCFKHFVYDARRKKYAEFYKYVSKHLALSSVLWIRSFYIFLSNLKTVSFFYLSYICRIFCTVVKL